MQIPRYLLLLILLACSLPAQVTHYQIRFVTSDPSGSCAPSYVTVNKTTGNIMGCVGGTWANLGAGGAPSGSAGGDLAGTYPNPTLANKNLANGPVVLNNDGGALVPGGVYPGNGDFLSLTAAGEIDFVTGYIKEGEFGIKEEVVPAAAGSGVQILYIDSTSHHLSLINSSSIVTDLEAPCSICEITTRKNQANGYLGLDAFGAANLANPGVFYVAPPGGAPTEGSTLGSDGLTTPRLVVGRHTTVPGAVELFEGVPPAADNFTQALFLDPTTHHLQRKNNSSTIVDLETPTAANVILGFSGTCNSSSAMMGDGTCAAISSAFSAVTAGTNAAALVMGSGGSLTVSGSGTINATSLSGNAIGTSGAAIGLLNANLTFSGTDKFTGAVSVNRNAAALPSAQTGTVFQIGNADSSNTRIETDAFAASGFFTALRYNGTAASPTTLVADDQIGGYNAWGYNGTSAVGPQVSFRSYAAQTWTGTHLGAYADIAVTPNNGTTMAESIRFEQSGGITVPNTVTGGDQGAGTLNAGGIYVAGVSVNNASILTAGSLAAARMPALTGDCTTSAGAVATTCTAIGGKSITLANSFTTAGNFALTLTQTGTTNVTLPTSGTLVAGGNNLTHSTAPACTTSTAGVLGECSANLIISDNGSTINIGNSTFVNRSVSYGTDRLGLTVPKATFSGEVLLLDSSGFVKWDSATGLGGTDTGLYRNAAGVVEVNSGTAGTFRDLKLRHSIAAGTAPTIASGFGSSPAIAGADAGGRVTVGTGGVATTGAITFGTAYSTAPACTVNDETSVLLIQATATTTTLTLSAATPFGAADKLTWACVGY